MAPTRELPQRLNIRPLVAPAAVGLGLSLLLLTTLAYVLWGDHEQKIHSAERRVSAIALGSDRLVTVEMRNLERALQDIARDSERLLRAVPAEANTLIQQNIDGVAGRHGELIDIVLVDQSGRALTRGRGDPLIADWTRDPRNRIGADGLIVGPAIRFGPRHEWTVSLAEALHPGSGRPSTWVLARLRLSALTQAASGLDVGQHGSANILHRNGTILVQAGISERFVGRDFPRLDLMDAALRLGSAGTTELVSPLDGVRRLVAYRVNQHYPLLITIGVSRQEVLGPWNAFAAVSALVCLLYGLGWLLLMRTLLGVNRRQAATLEQLEGSQESLLEAQRIGGFGSWSMDLGSGLAEFSPQAREIYGWHPGHPPLTLDSCIAQVHPEEREEHRSRFMGYLASGEFLDTTFRIVRPDGDVRSIVARGRILAAAPGTSIVGTFQDITELERAHAKARDTEAQYRLLFEHNPLPFWVFHRETLRILEANAMAAELYGYTREELQNLGLTDIRPIEDVADALAAARQDDPQSRHGRVWRHLRKDGRPLNVAVHAADIDFHGQPARLVLSLDVTERLEAQRLLELSENRFQLIARATSDAVFDWDMKTGHCWRSESFDTLFHYGQGQMPHTIDAWRERVHRGDIDRVNASLETFFASNEREWQASYRFLRGDGSHAFVLDRGTLQRDGLGKPVRMVGGMVDTSRQHKDEAELRLLRRAIESTENGIALVDARAADMPMVYVNPAFEQITGYASSEVIGRNCRFLQGGDHGQEGLEAIRAGLKLQREAQALLRNYRKDGELFYNQLSLSPVRDEDGTLTHFVGVIHDVTERHLHESQLAYQASHDELTGLSNRSALLDGVKQALAAAGGERIALLHLDVNNFKLINDSLGHEVGDEVLRAVARRLQAQVGDAGHVARIAGDEFVAMLVETAGRASTGELIARITASLAEPIEVLSTLHYLSLSIGIARADAPGITPEELLKHAGLATHEAKRRGHKHLVEYSPAFARAVSDRQQLVSRLHEAMEREEFELYFQPLFSAASQQPTGMEALIRWRHPERGLVPPSEFIPVCEESGLIVPLGRWVLREACRHHQLLAEAGWSELTIAVNVSAAQFVSGELQRDIPNLLREFSVPHGVLELELTEGLVMENPESVIEVMRELREHGVLLSIDDFGTGYSSMSYLHRLPVDKLKIDRSFVSGVNADSHNAAICDSILALARSFDLRVIAEGVETTDELEWLRRCGCDEIQGYLLARPAPFAQMVAALAR